MPQVYSTDFDAALFIALEVHAGQVDLAGMPYILHPIRIAMRQRDPRLRVIALLHDTIEDCPLQRQEEYLHRIGDLFGPEVLAVVRLLSRPAGMDYFAYLERLSLCADARRIKISDLRDNLDPARATPRWSLNEEKRGQYLVALYYLELVSYQQSMTRFPELPNPHVENVEGRNADGV